MTKINTLPQGNALNIDDPKRDTEIYQMGYQDGYSGTMSHSEYQDEISYSRGMCRGVLDFAKKIIEMNQWQ